MNEAEFLRQIKENQGIIYKLVSLYADDAEYKKDLYQEILLQTWKAYSNYRQEAKFSTWLYRICLNTILTQQRKKPLLKYIVSLESVSPTVHNLAEQNEDSDRLRIGIKQLSEIDRAITSLHLDGYENSEIAEMIGISTNNIAVKLFRIKQQLAKILIP